MGLVIRTLTSVAGRLLEGAAGLLQHAAGRLLQPAPAGPFPAEEDEDADEGVLPHPPVVISSRARAMIVEPMPATQSVKEVEDAARARPLPGSARARYEEAARRV